MTWQFWSVAPVWALAVAGAILVQALAPRAEYFTGIGIVLATAVIATFTIQLAIRRKEGFVNRTMASIGVAVVILAVASAAASVM